MERDSRTSVALSRATLVERFWVLVDLFSDVGGKIVTAEFGADVFLAIDFRCGEEAAFTDALRELSAGKITAEVSAARFDLF